MIRVHLICAASEVAEADAVLTSLWSSDQSGSFSVPLSPSGTGTATHYGCSGLYEEEQLAVLESSPRMQVGTGISFERHSTRMSLCQIVLTATEALG